MSVEIDNSVEIETNDSVEIETIVKFARPEKVTKFLSELFPTERDRLYFELVRDTCDWDPEANVAPNRIQLEVSNHDYINKLKSLRDNYEYALQYVNTSGFGIIGFCGFCEDEKLISENFGNNYIAIYDIYNTDKDINKQKEFINKMCNDESNEYIFIVKESLINNDEYKGKGLFKTYSLVEYNDDEYNIAEYEKQVYRKYLCNLRQYVRNVCSGKWHSINNMFDVVDLYLEDNNKPQICYLSD